jgi:S-DNA-T family DNA segregation ATPase FtsK/SpoIIIE
MKLKLTLSSAGQESRDLVAVIDHSTTVGDLATYLAEADPVCPEVDLNIEGPELDELTLSVVDQSNRVIDSRLTVPQSGLRSGVTVALTRCDKAVVDVGPPVAVAVAVAGPDSGKEFHLCTGTAYIGRGHGAQIRLSDSSVSRRHAKLVVAGHVASGEVIEVVDVVEVVDLGSANGISVRGAEVPRAFLNAGDRVTLGDTEIEVRLSGSGGVLNVSTSGSADSAGVSFTRSPRIAPLFEGRRFDLPDLPERPKVTRMPWLAMMFPTLMGMGLFAFTQSPYSLMFVLMSPMMMLGNYVEQRRGAKKDFASLMADFREDLEIVTTQIRESLSVEADQRRLENPSSAECAESIRGLSPVLWTRRGDMPGFLQLRLGRGALPSRSSLAMPVVGRSSAHAWSELVTSLEGLSVVSDVPVVVDPLSTGAIGISGPRRLVLAAARSLLLQAVTLHSPAELIVCAFAPATTAGDWDWLKWVPHTAPACSLIAADRLASTAPACSALLSQLEALVGTGDEPDTAGERFHPSRPCVLVLVENEAPAERSRLVHLAEKGWRQGICVLWLAPTTPSLPAACRVFIEVEAHDEGNSEGGRDGIGGLGGVGYVREGKLVTSVALDLASLEQTVAAARLLAPVEDSGAPGDESSDLPRAVSLLTLTGTELARSENAILERWGESRSILTGPFAPELPHRRAGNLRAIIGQ